MGGHLGLGVIFTLLAFVGLVMAAKAHDAVFHASGLILMLFSVIAIFVLIDRGMDAAAEEERGGSEESA